MDVLEKVTNNTDILAEILKYLNVKEQLKISKLYMPFRYTLVNIIWRHQCKDLRIVESLDNNGFVQMKNSSSEHCLTDEELHAFLRLNNKNIRKLHLQFGNKLNNLISYNLKNLISISFDHTKVTNEILQMFNNQSGKLENLHLIHCLNDENLPLCIGRDIEISTLNRMKFLKDLSIIGAHNHSLRFSIMQSIFEILNLSTFSTNIPINDDTNYETIKEIYSIDNLNIGRFCDKISWSTFTEMDLPKFGNLHKLSIALDPCVMITINDDFIAALSSTSHKLRELSFRYCNLNIENISVLEDLQRLSLDWCWGLKWRNLKQILNDLKLEIFTSLNSLFQGDFIELAYSSPTLKTIKLETSLIPNLSKALTLKRNNFENLSTLLWCNFNNTWQNFFQTKLENISLIYPKLQELVLEQHYLLMDDLRQLNHLKILQFHLFPDMTWSYLQTLLQHNSLEHLAIEISLITSATTIMHSITNADDRDIPKSHKNQITNLKFLKIPLGIFIKAQDFWLDFLQKNSKMKIMIFNYYGYELFNTNFLCNLLNHRKFPSKRKYINISGNDIVYNETYTYGNGSQHRYLNFV